MTHTSIFPTIETLYRSSRSAAYSPALQIASQNIIKIYLEDETASDIRPIVWIPWLALGPLTGTVALQAYYRLSVPACPAIIVSDENRQDPASCAMRGFYLFYWVPHLPFFFPFISAFLSNS
ncbi:hypothetical protein K438DRAFT_958931 [Mycena galopus ATCC 62051]|nr:hypothetical protein K438DRAFT_958931 [Mycena galopus ATCC 62051]